MNGFNPMSLMMQQLSADPRFQQAQRMASGKSPDEIRAICQNVCKQHGIDFDQAYQRFQSQFGLR